MACDLPPTVVDGNVERGMARLHNDHTPLPAAKAPLTAYADALTPQKRPGDYAQAVMDLGATICTPKNPACGICPWRDPCKARAQRTAPVLPKQTPKKPKPVRHGIAYVARTPEGAWLLETRPDKGLLGGMKGWPGSDWVDSALPLPGATPPVEANWQNVGEVRHTFTHFHLILHVQTATTNAPPNRGASLDNTAFRPRDLPTLIRNAFDLPHPSHSLAQ